MLEGFYTAASGILVQERTLGVHTNNMTNVRTPGYRAERVVSRSFDQELLMRQEANNSAAIGSGSPIRLIDEVPVDFTESSLEESGRPSDLAIVGEGYFNVMSADGERYLTRNGQFDLDVDGFLVLPGGGRLMGEDGEIELEDANFTVNQDGEIMDKKGKVIDTILLTKPAPDAEFKKFTNGLYTVEDASNIPVYESTIHQGNIERPNIDLNREYTMVMDAQRTLQSCATALKIVDTMNQKTATQIASL